MLLVIDIGNSHIKFGLANASQIIWQTRSPTVTYTSIEIPKQYEPTMACISSVVSGIHADFKQWLKKQVPSLKTIFYIDEHWMKQHQYKHIDCNQYRSTLGVDRLMNLYGAISNDTENKFNKIIVDFGTMTTIDLLDNTQKFWGGIIMPGPGAMNKLLTTGIASQLTPYEIDILDRPANIIGTTTENCLKSGFYYGHLGMVEKLISILMQQSKWSSTEVTLLLTGGGAQKMLNTFNTYQTVQLCPDLTLLGIENFYYRELNSLH